MRTIDADALLEHVWRDKLDSRELIANMIENAPTIYKGGLIWTERKNIPISSLERDLFLGYKKGWQLFICYWQRGYGWYRIDTNRSVTPELVAQINLLN